jgi:hypothetical protein
MSVDKKLHKPLTSFGIIGWSMVTPITSQKFLPASTSHASSRVETREGNI